MSGGSGNFGAMMTLAQLSALSPNPRPSGETAEQQAQRILTGINSTLLDTALATSGLWQAAWIALSQDRGNLCYIAMCPTQNAFAVCCRGTQFNSLVDLVEDLAVSTLAQFSAGDTPLLISQGSMKAFTDATNAQGLPSGTLLEALTLLLSDAPSTPQPTVYITGHSLGGAMATTIAVYLASQNWANAPSFAVYTFAAPSAGLASFANYYDQILTNQPPNQTWRVYNQYDAVPYAWADLSYVRNNFYPSPSKKEPGNPGPYQDITVRGLLSKIADISKPYVYTQTNGNSSTGKNTTVLNSDYSVYNPAFVHTTTGDFLGQVGYQHNCYLKLLEVSELPGAGIQGGPPVVQSISPNNGLAAGGTLVRITGGVFTADCAVDFGTVPAVVTSITANQITVVQPPGAGTVDVRVTNLYGTSAAVSADQFAAPQPVAPTVSKVSPGAGPPVPPGNTPYKVTVTGTGFVIPSSVDYAVDFGTGNAGSDVTVVSLTEIEVTPPAAGGGIVDVQVTNVLGMSAAAPPGDQFTFGPPIVTGVTPSSGPAKKSPQVTITGFGFAAGCTVKFVHGKTSKDGINLTVVNDTTIAVTPPDVTPAAGDETVDVTVTNSFGTSAITPNDQYVYYADGIS